MEGLKDGQKQADVSGRLCSHCEPSGGLYLEVTGPAERVEMRLRERSYSWCRMCIQRKPARSKWETQGGSVSVPLCREDRTWERGAWRWPRAGRRWMPACVCSEAVGHRAWCLLLLDVVTGQWGLVWEA